MKLGSAWPKEQVAMLRKYWSMYGGRIERIAKAMGRTNGSISGKSRVLGLQFLRHGEPATIDSLHPASLNRTTMFPSKVTPVDGAEWVLKSGDNQRKLGKWVTKGRWKGFPIFSLTLVERETCPTSCQNWYDCFGNSMAFAKRYKYTDALFDQLSYELSRLQLKYPEGFVVRLHLLGDFPDLKYLSFWRIALDAFPALRIFGYTHWPRTTKLGRAIHELREAEWERFAIRTSDAPNGARAVTIRDESQKGDAIICPAQLSGGGGRQCGSCALCWSVTAKNRAIAFLLH